MPTQTFSAIIASNEEEEDIYQLRIDRINVDIAAAAACEVVALAITKLTFEDPPIIMKGFSVYL